MPFCRRHHWQPSARSCIASCALLLSARCVRPGAPRGDPGKAVRIRRDPVTVIGDETRDGHWPRGWEGAGSRTIREPGDLPGRVYTIPVFAGGHGAVAHSSPRVLVVAGVASGVGKTTITLGLLEAFRRRGLVVQAFKIGPDFIDPGFHELITG